MMARKLYTCLLLMHPPVFRGRFAEEMLCIFDEASLSAGAFTLIVDAVASLGRQWILRSESWKLALAIIGACLQVAGGGLIWVALGRRSPLHRSTLSGPDSVALIQVMRFIVAAVIGIVLMVAAASFWMKSFVRTRSRGLRLGR
jgi:hypothetical protein